MEVLLGFIEIIVIWAALMAISLGFIWFWFRFMRQILPDAISMLLDAVLLLLLTVWLILASYRAVGSALAGARARGWSLMAQASLLGYLGLCAYLVYRALSSHLQLLIYVWVFCWGMALGTARWRR
jgi:hypothetical protein